MKDKFEDFSNRVSAAIRTDMEDPDYKICPDQMWDCHNACKAGIMTFGEAVEAIKEDSAYWDGNLK